MKKTNLILPVLTRKNAFRCGVVALALVTMTGCKDDAPGIDGPGGNDVTETVEGIDLSVLSNPALAKTYYNSKLFGSRAANDVPEFPGMPEIPTADELAAMIQLPANYNGNWITVNVPADMKEADFNEQILDRSIYVPAGANVSALSSSITVTFVHQYQNSDNQYWQKPVTLDNLKYYIDGEVTCNGTGSNTKMEIHILNGGKLIDKSILQSNTVVYVHRGGDILRASQSGDKNIHIEGTLVSEADLVHGDIDFELMGECYTTGKLHGKNITLVGGKVYAGCAVTAEDTIYLTGNNSIISAGYVSAPVVELAGNSPLEILLRDGGYLLATEQLNLKNIGNVFVRAEEGDYAMVETKVLDVNDKDLRGTFYNVAVNYDSQSGTLEKAADETEVTLAWNESVKVKEQIDYTVEDGDDCAPKVIEGPTTNPTPDPTPDPELENIGSIEPAEHQHPISATSIFTVGNDAYVSWHTQGTGFHGCIEHLTVDNGTVTLNSYLETAPTNSTYGAIDFNHVIFDNGKIFVAGDHPDKGGILGWINCDGGTFPTGNTAKLNLITLYKEQYVNAAGDTVYSNGGSGNCIIRNGEYYQTASVAGFETFNVADFTEATWKLKSVAKLPSWKFDPSLAEAPVNPWERDGSRTGKHIATDGAKVVMLSLINRDKAANTANASVKVFNATDINYENEIASYVVEDVLLSPVDGKDVIAIEGNDIWVCLGQGGVKHLALAGNTLTEVASFRLTDKSKEELKGWEMSTKEAAAACANGLAVDKDYVYIAHGAAGLIVLKKNDLSFVTRTRHNGGNSANYISLHPNGYIYVAYGKSKVQVFAWK
ncbi:MAG: hypothetical protein J6B03_06595 [Candidatus Homeothermus sp.]|nr:hypothetical protein [Candidatus Homeothermus sp.]